MPIKLSKIIPKALFTTPKIPSIAVVGLMVVEYAILSNVIAPEPKCTLNVERPHYSTYLKETRNIDAIKLNITSECNVPQDYTEVESSIRKLENGRQVVVYAPGLERRESLKSDPKKAEFRDLFALCRLGKSMSYVGSARGLVYLKGGGTFPVKDDSGIFRAANCGIGAQ
jgi:hypothetical protein